MSSLSCLLLVSITRQTSLLRIQLDTDDDENGNNSQNLVVSGSNNYIRPGLTHRHLFITCTKLASGRNAGVAAKTNASNAPNVTTTNTLLSAFVNTRSATPVDSACDQSSHECTSQQFAYDLESDRAAYVEVWCRLAITPHQSEIASIFLHKLCMHFGRCFLGGVKRANESNLEFQFCVFVAQTTTACRGFATVSYSAR